MATARVVKTSPKWKSWFRGTSPSGRHAHSAVVHSGSMYVFGGYGQGGVHLGDFYRLDLETRTWEELSGCSSKTSTLPLDHPPPVHSHSCVVCAQGDVDAGGAGSSGGGPSMLLFGGISRQSVTDGTVYRFSFSSRRWSRIETHGAAPPGRWGHTACIVGPEMVVYGGMRASGDFLSEIHALDLGSLMWRRVETEGAGPAPSHHHAACTVGNSLFTFGGYGGNRNLGALFRLDISPAGSGLPSKWNDLSSIPGAPAARRGERALSPPLFSLSSLRFWGENPPAHTLVHHAGTLFVFGGRGSKVRLNDVHAFDISSGTWREVECDGDGPSPRGFATAVVYSSRMVIFGGLSDECLNDIHFLDLPEDRPAPASGHERSGTRRQQRLGPALGALFEEGLFADVRIVLPGGERPINAHRAVLAARSDHFRALLTSGLSESRSGDIVLEDVPGPAFRQLVRFLYTDRVDVGSGDELVELLVLADRFVVEPLRARCELMACDAVSPENAAELKQVAVCHNCPLLVERCDSILAASKPLSAST